MRTRAWPPDGAFGSGTSTIFKFWAGLPYAVRWMAFIGDILLVPTNPGLYYDSKIRDGLWKGAPDDVDAATNRHDALAAIGSVSTSCAIGEKERSCLRHHVRHRRRKPLARPLRDLSGSFSSYC